MRRDRGGFLLPRSFAPCAHSGSGAYQAAALRIIVRVGLSVTALMLSACGAEEGLGT